MLLVRHVFAFVVLVSVVVAATADARTIRVPGDQSTIQAGINAAASRDTVLVAPRTYTGAGNKNLTFGGRNLVLLSEAGAKATIIDCEGDGRGFIFSNRETAAAVVEGFTIRNGFVSGRGGGLCCRDSSPTILNCTITGNTANGGGGIFCSRSAPQIVDCVIGNNVAEELGAGIGCAQGTSATVSRTVIDGNVAGYEGGGVYVSSNSEVLLVDAVLSGNAAENGGGLHTLSTATALRTTISGNSADQEGGGWWGAGVIESSTVEGNTAATGGGAHGVTIVRSSTVTGNSADIGGGLYGPVELEDNLISANVATVVGGGVFVSGGLLDVSGGEFLANRAADGGGLGIEDGALGLSSVLFADNAVTGNGAGIHLHEADVLAIASEFSTNSADGHGGGGYFVGSTGTIEGCDVLANVATAGGGGFSFVSGGCCLSPRVVACSLDANVSDGTGGAIEARDVNTHVVASLVLRNQADQGGAFWVAGARPSVVNCTITENVAKNTGDPSGGALYAATGGPVVVNSILWQNMPNEISSGEDPPKVSYSDVDGGYPGHGNLDVDPQFRDVAAGDYRLRTEDCDWPQTSPAIDAGDPLSVDVLFDCEWGLIAERADMGRYGGPANLPCDLEVVLVDVPDVVQRGSVFSFRVEAHNTCLEARRFDEVVMVIGGPVDLVKPLYRGGDVFVPGSQDVGTRVEQSVPPGALVGDYAVRLEIADDGIVISSASFVVTVQ